MESPQSAETSVLFSLAELAEIERERIAEEERTRSAARAEQARERARAAEERRAEESARRAAELEARARREREQAEARARLEAQARAAADVARIQAEAKARLEADNAARAHELALIRARTDRQGRRGRQLLVALLGVSLSIGVVVTVRYADRVARLEQEGDRLRAAERALLEGQQQARRTALAALDRRHAALASDRADPSEREHRDTAARARAAIDAERIDERGLQELGSAIDRWELARDRSSLLEALDRRLEDLLAWSSAARATELAAEARSAAQRARAPVGGSESVARYERALDELRAALAQSAGAPSRGIGPGPRPSDGRGCSDPHDPMCGLDGKTL